MTTSTPLQLGLVGAGRMGSNIARRIIRDGHSSVVFDLNTAALDELVTDGAVAATSLANLVEQLATPRAIWLMLPAALTQSTLDALVPLLSPDDVVIDGGNSFYQDDIIRARQLATSGIHYVDCGTSGGVWGLERGYSLMIGGEAEIVARLEPLFVSLSPGDDGTRPTPGRESPDSSARSGYLHCGPNGAGHFVKMVHNGVEYGMMAALAEGFNIMRHANVGLRPAGADAETSPLRNPEFFAYDFNLADIAESWRHGSVVSSWLLDLTATALANSPDLAEFSGYVSDSGEGRWTVEAAINESVPVPVISAALWQRYESRREGEFAAQMLSAMRAAFGGHVEKPGR